MKLGVGVSSVRAVELVEIAKQNGVSGVLCGTHQLKGLSPAQFRELVDASGLEVCQWGSWAYNPLLPTPETLQRTLDHIATAAEVGSRTLAMPGGSFNPDAAFCAHPDNFTDQAIRQAAAALERVAQAAQDKGVVIALECHFATVLTNWRACKQMLEQIGSPWVRLEFDGANMVRLENYWDTGTLLREGFDRVGEQIATCHAKDVVLRPQLHLHLDECPAGEGCLDWTEFIRLMDERLRPDIYLIIEHTPAQKIAGVVEYLRTCAAKAGVTIQR